MQQNSSGDRSTLASLLPNQGLERRWRRFRNAPRYQGSHLLTLRRPTRHPEGSRKYVHGDPVAMIDWKAFARSDQLIVRVKRDEASARICIAIDASATMFWPDQTVCQEAGRQVPTKVEVASRIGLNLAHAHLVMGDLVEVLLVTEEAGAPKNRYAPRSPADIVSLFHRIRNDGFTIESLAVPFAIGDEVTKPCDVSYWVGDGLSTHPIRAYLQRGRQSAMIHLLSCLERDTSWLKADRCYFDEEIVKKEYQGQLLLTQQNYEASLERWLQSFARDIKKSGALYLEVTDVTPIQQFYRYLDFFE